MNASTYRRRWISTCTAIRAYVDALEQSLANATMSDEARAVVADNILSLRQLANEAPRRLRQPTLPGVTR